MKNSSTFAYIERIVELRKIDIFSKLNPGQLRHLATLARPLHVGANVKIVDLSERYLSFYAIVSGSVCVSYNTKEVCRFGGGFFNEKSLFLFGEDCSEEVVSIEDTELFEFPAEAVRLLLMESPSISLKIAEYFVFEGSR